MVTSRPSHHYTAPITLYCIIIIIITRPRPAFGRLGEKWAKWSKIAKNGLNGLKWSKMVQMVENGQKWSKMAGLTLSGPNVPA